MKSAILFLKSRMEGAVALQTGRLFLWLPVTMGAGAAIYLNLSFEPALWWMLSPAIICLAALVVARRYGSSGVVVNLLILLAAFALGAAVCKLRTEHVRAPVLSSDISSYTLQAYVIDVVSPSADQPRLLLAPIYMRGLRPENTPLRLRVSLRPGTLEGSGIKPGDAISAFAGRR